MGSYVCTLKKYVIYKIFELALDQMTSKQTTPEFDLRKEFDLTSEDLDIPDTTCSLSAAFDQVWSCYTLGRQATHYYRYGTRKDCAGKLDDLKFCLSLKTKGAGASQKMIEERERAKAEKKRHEKSSLDVWTLREAPPDNWRAIPLPIPQFAVDNATVESEV